MRLETKSPAPGEQGQGGRAEAGNLNAKYTTGKAILRSVRKDGEATVYSSLEPEDVATLRACGFDPRYIGHGFFVCWEPVPVGAGGETHA